MIGKLWPACLQISLKTNLFTDRSEYVVIEAGKHSKLFKTDYFYSFMILNTDYCCMESETLFMMLLLFRKWSCNQMISTESNNRIDAN